MPELIDKNALIRKFCAECQHCYRVDKAGGEPTMCKTVMMIAEMPTIEPEVQHGQWSEMYCYKEYGVEMADYECTNCGGKITKQRGDTPKYCEHCGAKMRKGADNG